ncbi:DUF6573 family protein [Xylanimonas allomyrinae]|uniref:DUF6573 family protein n=1 Tax=Xylanimonas allomyrinae TaxID=2509459 RepID=UPI0026A8BA07
MDAMHELFGEVIHAYTRAQAIEDGVLVDATETAREAGFAVPVALTAAAWADAVAWNHGGGQDEAGRLWDVLFMAAMTVRGVTDPTTTRVPVRLLRVPNTARARRATLTTLHLHSGPATTASTSSPS